MVTIEPDEIIQIHNIISKRFNVSVGILNKGLLDSITHRPHIKINNKYQYDDVFKKTASLLEGIIRLHPFADGNKRTALLTAVYFLRLHNYAIALPISSVRYSVQIAKNNDISQKETERLIKDISKWLKKYSANTRNEYDVKYFQYLYLPSKVFSFLFRIKLEKYVIKKMSDWLALDIYPEYANRIKEIIDFIGETSKNVDSLFEDNE